MYYNNVLELIGNTPLVKLNRLSHGLKPTVLCKLEYLNPGSSIKDRIGLKMIEDAEKKGLISPGGTIIEGTSGNTGVGLALAAVMKGYRCIFVMPDKMSQEKISALRAYGAEVVVTPTAVAPEDPRSYYSVSQRLSEEIPNSYYPNQYKNPSNPQTHYESTGPEIWEQTEGKVTHFVAGMGTGGTLSGIARYLKEQNPAVQVIGVDPIGSLYWDKFHKGEVIEENVHPYLVEGIGEDFLPTTMDLSMLDDVIRITDKDCFMTARALARREGIFTGGSGGAAVWGALEVAKKCDENALIVTLLPDSGSRYLTKVFNDTYLRDNGMLGTMVELNGAQLIGHKTDGPSQLYSVSPESSVLACIKLMRAEEISQLPVLDDGAILGSVREDQIVPLLLQGENLEDIQVRSIMAEPLPVVDYDEPVSSISRLLTPHNPAVLIRQADGSLNILTKHDLIRGIEI